MKTFVGYVAAAAVVASVSASPTELSVRATKGSSGSLPAVSVKGNAFFAGSERFYIRGIDYQPGGSSASIDPIANAETCKRDIAEFNKLGINTIRVYTVDNSADHDECMNALADAGIYLALDVNTPKYSLNRDNPAPSYNAVYLQSIFATIDAFAQYSNTLLFFSGNEVINSDNTTSCAPYVKAVTRDMRQYIGSRGYRSIPVGYSAADVESNRYEMAQYMNCGTDDQRSDFFAFNDYSWCDPSTYQQSGWDQKVKLFSNYSLPLFLSEYGCITNERQFNEIAALYGSQMTPVYSGGLVYEYSEEGNGYGLVNIKGGSIDETSDFQTLAKKFAANKAPTGNGGYKANGEASTCPSASSTWEVHDFTGANLPAIPNSAAKYMTSGAGKGPGLSGAGSQWAADSASTSTATPGSGKVTSVTGNGTGNGTDGATAASQTPNAASTIGIAELGFAPFVLTGVVVVSTLLGTTLL